MGDWRSEFEKNVDGKQGAEPTSALHTVKITVFLGELLQSEQVFSMGPSKTTIRIIGGGEGDIHLPIAHDNQQAVVELSHGGLRISAVQTDDLPHMLLNGRAIGCEASALQHGDIVTVGPYRLEIAVQSCDCKA
ncbi:hypothetical protein [Nannocystis pusilla]|uniref:hypothetical protein n=1 Tax=Nannocystis pusilla TaxID=889268 RepID=UPI003B80A4A2